MRPRGSDPGTRARPSRWELTLGFEFGAGRYAGKPWSVILADYDVMRGRLWVLVPIITFLAPYWVGRARGLWSNR